MKIWIGLHEIHSEPVTVEAVMELLQVCAVVWVVSINDDNDVVLGYFDAASLQEERIFIKRGEFPYFAVPDYYAGCIDTVVSYGLIPAMIRQGFMLVGEVPGGRYLLSMEPCIDCTLTGTNVKPDFW